MKTNGAKNRSVKESAAEESSLVPLLKKEFARWGLTALVSLWAFVLGILVGRGSAPVTFDIPKLEEKLTALKSAALEREKEHFEEMRLKPPDVEFYEELKKGGSQRTTLSQKSPGREERSASSPSPPSDRKEETATGKSDSDGKTSGTAETESRPEPKPLPEKVPAFKSKKDNLALKRKSAETSEQTREEHPEPPKAAPRPTPKAAPKATPKPPTRKPATEGPTNRKSDKKVTIQVASFRRLDDARKVVSKLRGKGYGAYVVSGEVPGQGLYFRVKIGTFNNKAAAGDVMKGLRGEYPNCFLSRRD